MKTPKPNLAEQLFANKTADPNVVVVFATGIVEALKLRAFAWCMVTVLNFVFFILIPAYALFSPIPALGWLLIPGIFLGIVLAALSPKGTV